jgi:intracellular sulfur oxidation DsrE/DsrF family protein
LPNIPGIKTMKARGALYCVCNLATKVFSGMIAARMGLTADEVYKEMVAGLIPGVQLVPSGVWALGRAQENGTGYIFAGD